MGGEAYIMSSSVGGDAAFQHDVQLLEKIIRNSRSQSKFSIVISGLSFSVLVSALVLAWQVFVLYDKFQDQLEDISKASWTENQQQRWINLAQKELNTKQIDKQIDLPDTWEIPKNLE